MSSRIQQITEMLKTDPNDSFLTYALALEHEKDGAIKTAVEIIEQLLQRDPNYLGGYYKLGQLYEQFDELEKARKIYHTGIQLSDNKKDMKTKGELEEALWLIEE